MINAKFRGLTKSGNWEYGVPVASLWYGSLTLYMIDEICGGNLDAFEPVNEKTIGQFTGLKDVSGVDIYVGDIVRETRTNPSWDSDMVNILPVTYIAPSFMIGDLTASNDYLMISREVIGNIHQNSELLK